jgi:catalase
MPDSDDQFFEGIDLLDPTKIVPEELVPVRRVGKLTLDRNPTNFFAETEQVAFCAGNFVPGIQPTDDPLLQARLFSYLDTQLTRLGGPNFQQIPINRPRAAVNDNERDGFMQQAIHEGRASYAPNSVGGGCPFADPDGAFVVPPEAVSGTKIRERAQSFDDHFSQATLFWNSMALPERDHIVGAFSFELGKCESDEVVERVLGNLAQVDGELCERVAANVGKRAPRGRPATDAGSSPALSMMLSEPGPVAGRVVGVLVGAVVDLGAITRLRRSLTAASAVLQVVAPHGGPLDTAGGPNGRNGARATLLADKAYFHAQAVELDAVVIAPGCVPDPALAVQAQEAYRHHKPIAAWGDGVHVLDAFGIPASAPGVVTGASMNDDFTGALVEAMGWHRFWERGPSVELVGAGAAVS